MVPIREIAQRFSGLQCVSIDVDGTDQIAPVVPFEIGGALFFSGQRPIGMYHQRVRAFCVFVGPEFAAGLRQDITSGGKKIQISSDFGN